MTTNAELWAQIAPELRRSITDDTWRLWFADVRPTEDPETFLLEVASTWARDWIRERLAPLIESLTDAAGSPRPLRLTVATPRRSAPRPQPDPTPDTEIAVILHHSPANGGFTITSNYAIQFWQPLIGSAAFSLWLTIRSYAMDAGATTKPAWPSIQTLADITSRGHRQRLTGRRRSSKDKTYYQPGLLDRLQAHHVLRIDWQTEPISFHCVADLPLLTPEQTNELTHRRQLAHRAYLRRHRLSCDHWQQLSFTSLLAVGDD